MLSRFSVARKIRNNFTSVINDIMENVSSQTREQLIITTNTDKIFEKNSSLHMK